jgi:hypothetical protein
MTDPRLLTDEYRLVASLRIAVRDMAIAQASAARLAYDVERDENIRAGLATGAIVSYARPWTRSEPIGAYAFPLDRHAPESVLADLLPPESSDERELHTHVVDVLRPKAHAHTDAGEPWRGVGPFEVVLEWARSRSANGLC